MNNAATLSSLRSEIRAWLEQNCPHSRRGRGVEGAAWGGRNRSGQDPEALRWMEAMAARGFIAPTWSKIYGGAGLTEAEARILDEELRFIAAPLALMSLGLWMLAPILFEYGTETQRQRFLPPIARGELRWCQGYSEPNAGSDLAALQTRCEDMGDHWLINGQKIWTTGAHLSDWMFCLVRTDQSSKQGGISFVLIDTETPGVERRPIKLISGSSPFCETFLTEVRIPKDQMVGRLNGGWEIAKRLLQYERQTSSHVGGVIQADLHESVRKRRGVLDARTQDRVVRLEMRRHALALTLERAREEGEVSQLASALKISGSVLQQDRQELIVDALGMQSLMEDPDSGSDTAEITDLRQWLQSRAATITGGTTEINLNVIAKRILLLPDPQ